MLKTVELIGFAVITVLASLHCVRAGERARPTIRFTDEKPEPADLGKFHGRVSWTSFDYTLNKAPEKISINVVPFHGGKKGLSGEFSDESRDQKPKENHFTVIYGEIEESEKLKIVIFWDNRTTTTVMDNPFAETGMSPLAPPHVTEDGMIVLAVGQNDRTDNTPDPEMLHRAVALEIRAE